MSISAKLIEEATNKPDLLAAAHEACISTMLATVAKNTQFTFSDGSKLRSCSRSTLAWTEGGTARIYPDYIPGLYSYLRSN